MRVRVRLGGVRTVVRVDQVHSAEPVAVQAARERLQHVAHASLG